MTTVSRVATRRPTGPHPAARVVVWTVVAVMGAVAWGVLALSRGERISALWLLVAALATYAVAYRFYARFIIQRVLVVDDSRATPAERHDDGIDFHPTDRRVLFGHHFAAIAGAGPLVGPVLAAQMGYLPGTLWLVIGVVLAGAVQDMTVMFCSVRRDGRSLGQMVRDEVGPIGGWAAIAAVLAIVTILLAVLALVVVNALSGSPWGTFATAMTIPIALLMGVYQRWVRPGHVIGVSLIGLALLQLAVIGGSWVEHDPTWAAWFTLSPHQLVIALVVYGFLASVLPVWLLLTPRDYLSTFLKIGTIAVLAVAVLLAAPDLRAPAITRFATDGHGPVFAGSLFPFVFITIACGALSGFHSLIASGTTPKMIQKESQIRLIGYGGMLMESCVAVVALIAACLLDPGLYYAMNMSGNAVGASAAEAAKAVGNLGFTITQQDLMNAADMVGERSLVGRTGGAPTLAVGMAQLLSGVLGGKALMSFWYHFAILFEALFILTTVDAGTRVARFMLHGVLGRVWAPLGDTRWRPGAWLASLLVVSGWGYFLWAGVSDPLGGINQLFPLFGIANQLLAAVSLSLVTVVLVRSGKVRYAWVSAVPLTWDVLVTLTASLEKIFSDDPTLGFFAQRARYADALAAGKVLAPAKNLEQMNQVVLNSTVDGLLTGVFAVLVLIVVVSAARVCLRVLARDLPVGPDQTSQTPYQASQILTPTGWLGSARRIGGEPEDDWRW